MEVTALIEARIRGGDLAGAREACVEAMAGAPDGPALALLRGAIALRLGEKDEAVAHAGRAVQLDSRHPLALLALGAAQLAAGAPDFALPPLGRALAERPDLAEARCARAEALAALGREAEAGEAMDAAAVTAAVAAGETCFGAGFADQVAALGHDLLKAGETDAARRLFSSALGVRAHHARSLFGLALAAEGGEAGDGLRRAAAEAPGDPEIQAAWAGLPTIPGGCILPPVLDQGGET